MNIGLPALLGYLNGDVIGSLSAMAGRTLDRTAKVTRGVEVIDRIITGVNREQNLAILEELCDTMLHGSLCGLGGLTPYPVQSALKHFRQDFLAPPRERQAETH